MLVEYASTDGFCASSCSTLAAAASVSARPVPEGSFWVMVRLSLPMLPM